MDIKNIIDGAGDVCIRSEDKEYTFSCKANFWTDQTVSENWGRLYELYSGRGDKEALEAAYSLVSDMSRNATEDGKPLVSPEEVADKRNFLDLKGCLAVALNRYAEVMQDFSDRLPAGGKKKEA